MLLASFIAGLILLLVGAESLVRGASKLAISFGISPLLVGLTVVSFGTSAPELAVSVGGVLSGNSDVALGNVVGSNVLNVLLILGLSALITPLVVHRQLVRQEVPIMIGVSFLVMWMAFDGFISRGNGLLLVALLILYLVFLFWQARNGKSKLVEEVQAAPASGWDRHWSVQLLLIGAGLAMLVLGADWLVDAAVVFAQRLGVSSLVIGLTVVAVGTSLPEIATSILAALRGERDIAVGNVIGSNIFNLLAVLGIAASVSPWGIPVSLAVLKFDLPVMLAVALACLPIMFTGHRIGRREGALFFGYYLAYTAYLILYAQSHDALDEFSLVMTTVVIPLTVITLLIVVLRELRARRVLRSRRGD
jgi:cation:H+ antiporter